jgi:hypothetical protein
VNWQGNDEQQKEKFSQSPSSIGQLSRYGMLDAAGTHSPLAFSFLSILLVLLRLPSPHPPSF